MERAWGRSAMGRRGEVGDDGEQGEARPTSSVRPAGPQEPFGDARALTGARLCDDRFDVGERLGEGGTGVVYAAYDHARRETVALKVLARLEPANIRRLKSEFRSLVEVSHPNLVGLHELFHASGLWFFTMDLVRGVDLVSFVRGGGEFGGFGPTMAARLGAVFSQLAAGVVALHQVGKLHCDLKPSNVLVTEAGKVVILDFGLVTDSLAELPSAPAPAGLFGTPEYLSPERVEGARASAACDFYAMGVMLFESLTGELPFRGGRFEALRERTKRAVAPSPRELVPELPGDMCQLCEALLHPRPELRADAERVFVAFGARPVTTVASASTPPSQPAPPFVGRAPELAALEAAFVQMEHSAAPMVVTLPGLSGMGKSALMAQFCDGLASDTRALVLRGRCHAWETVPHDALDSVMDELAAFWRMLPFAEASEFLPDGIESLVRVFPVLSQVEAVARARAVVPVVLDPRELRLRASRALRDLLVGFGQRYALVVAIDDLQWGDRDGVRELVELLRGSGAPRVLLLCAYRVDEVAEDGPLEGLLAALADGGVAQREIPVGPLSTDAAESLASALGDPAEPRATAEVVAREAEGNPFFVRELALRGRRSAETRPPGLGALMLERWAQLSADERRLLGLVVVSPGPTRDEALRRAFGEASGYDACIRRLLGLGLVRTGGGRTRDLVEAYHDRIREAVAHVLDAQARAELHARHAEALASAGEPDDAPRLSLHLEAAGRLAEAARHYERAARRALDALAFDHAASLLRKALSLGDHTKGQRAALTWLLAEALASAGRGPESAQAYCEAAELGSVERRDRALLYAAEQWLFAGHHQQAFERLEGVLPRLGLRLPRSRASLLPRLVADGLRLAIGVSDAVRPPAACDPRAARLARVCATLGDAVLYVDFGLYAYFQQRHVLYGLQSGEPDRVAEALTTRAMLTASPTPHRFDAVRPDLQRAEQLAQELGEPVVRGRVALNRAIVFSAVGDYVETERLAREAERVFRSECRGIKWGLSHAVLWQSVALFYLGRFVDLGALCREHLPTARERGDRTLGKLLSVWHAWVELAAGRPEDALRVAPEPQLDAHAFTILDAGALTQRAPMLLYMGRKYEAFELFARGEAPTRRSGVLRARARAFEFHWTRGLSAAHLVAERAAEGVSKLLEKDIRELAGSKTPDSAAMAEHLRGARAGALGDLAEAREHYLAAARGYASLHMACFAATLELAAAFMVSDAGKQASLRAVLEGLGVGGHDGWLSLWCPGWNAR